VNPPIARFRSGSAKTTTVSRCAWTPAMPWGCFVSSWQISTR
jgi:hypothetical protein